VKGNHWARPVCHQRAGENPLKGSKKNIFNKTVLKYIPSAEKAREILIFFLILYFDSESAGKEEDEYRIFTIL